MQAELYKEQIKVLREEARMLLCKEENQIDQLELIDVLQRLGVAYHFNNEIRNILDNIYSMDKSKKKNLHATALEFRLLRQHGYDISTGFRFLMTGCSLLTLILLEIHTQKIVYMFLYCCCRCFS